LGGTPINSASAVWATGAVGAIASKGPEISVGAVGAEGAISLGTAKTSVGALGWNYEA